MLLSSMRRRGLCGCVAISFFLLVALPRDNGVKGFLKPLSLPSWPQQTITKNNNFRHCMALHMGMMTLYGSQGSRSPLVNWAAYELGLDLEMAASLADNPHPFGQIPCLVDENGIVVFESGAILLHLLAKSASQPSSQDEASIKSWIAWANASLDPICFLETPEGKVYDTGLKRPNRRIDQLNDILETKKYLLGDEFSIADVAVASYLLYVVMFFPDIDVASKWPNLARYMEEAASRPTYGDAFGAQVQSRLVENLRQQQKNAKADGEGPKLFGMF